MKKLFVLIFCLVVSGVSHAGLISTRSTAPATCSVGDVWINTGASAANDRIYTCTEPNTWTKNSGRPWVIQHTAPGDLSLIWFDDDQVTGKLVLKLHNGTTWVEQAMGEGSGTTYTAGTGIDITSGVISSTVTGTLPSATEGQGVQKGATAWEAVDLAPLAFTDNVSRNSSTGVVSVPVTATATSGSAVPLTSGGAYTALGGKQDTLVSGTNIKTINSTSILGSGNIDIAGGTGGYVTLSAIPYSDVACTTGQYGYYGSTAYLCTGGFWTSKWTLTTHSNASPTTYTLTIDGTGWNGTDLISVGGSTYTADGTKTGLSGETSITVTPDTGREATCSGTGITGSSSPYSADMSADRTIACTFADSSSATLLAHYSFESNNSGQWLDEVSGTNLGSTTGTVTPVSGGQTGNCIQTASNANYVTIPVQGILSGLDVFTLEYYIRVSSDIAGSMDTGVYLVSGGNGNWLQLTHENYDVGPEVKYRNGWGGTLVSATDIPVSDLTTNTWHKIELIVDFPNNQIKYYKNNVLVGTVSSAAITKWAMDSQQLIVLYKQDASGPTLSIDEYKIYSGSTK